MRDEQNVFKIAVASSFTIEPIKTAINYWAEQADSPVDLSFCPSLQVIQSLLDPTGLFAVNDNGVNLVFLRLEDMWGGGKASNEQLGALQAYLHDLERVIQHVAQSYSAPVVIVECPSSQLCNNDEYSKSVLEHYSRYLSNLLLSIPGAHYISEKDIFDLYPIEEYEDSFLNTQTAIPYLNEFFIALGTTAFRKVASFMRTPQKVIVVDCDNTLWKGTCADIGPENVIIDKGHMSFQECLVTAYKEGFLICLCSKNEEHDVWAAFGSHESVMPLKKQHIVSARINWLPKSQNISSLAEELGLGLDSFIFIDDNPTEIAEVSSTLPQVTAIQFPEPNSDLISFSKHLWVLDKPVVSETDRFRSEYYLQEKERKNAAAKALNLENFLAGLDLQVDFYPLSEEVLERVSQMTYRTNQFNLSGLKLSPQIIRQLYLGKEKHCLVIQAKDRYGDYGIVGCVFYHFTVSALLLENMLLSCRALGKNIEQQIWRRVCSIARDNRLDSIRANFVKTQRNQKAETFLLSMKPDDSNEDGVYTFAAGELADL